MRASSLDDLENQIKDQRVKLLEVLAKSNEIEGVKYLQGCIATFDWILDSKDGEEVN